MKKILNLVKQTGDRVVIFDGNNPDDSYVVMNFDNYAELRAGNEPIKSEIPVQDIPGVSRNTTVNNSEKSAAPVEFPPISAIRSDQTRNLTEEDLTDKINREISMWKNRDDSSYLGEENKPKKAWQIPSQVKDKAKEIE